MYRDEGQRHGWNKSLCDNKKSQEYS
jgi:hypothetical protein